MNIQNISALADQLKLLGFENAGYSILKRICFRPDHFIISQKVIMEGEQIGVTLFFEKNSKLDRYVLVYYDAILATPYLFNDSLINGIEIAGLEKQMAGIDWKKAFDFEEQNLFNEHDKASWEKEQRIESIMNSLSVLESTEEGRLLASLLKSNYWNGTFYFEMFESMSVQKNKSEISQRFYFFEEQAGISVEEAYRFLLNRQLEKQLQTKKKNTGIETEDETETRGNTSGTGLLSKKRIAKSSRPKKNKASIN